MSDKSTYMRGAMLDHNFGIAPYSAPASLWLGLLTSKNAAAEPVGNGYSRVEIVNDNTEWTRTGNKITNINSITFPQATGSQGTISHFALYDDETSGNVTYFGVITLNGVPTPKPVSAPDVVTFTPGQLEIIEE